MSKVMTQGLGKLIDDLADMGQTADEVVAEVMDFAQEELIAQWKASIREHDLIDSGDMLRSVKATVKEKNRVEVYPHGKDHKKVSNMEKAEIHNNGTPKIKATHFVDEAERRAAEHIDKKAGEVLDEWIKRHGWK